MARAEIQTQLPLDVFAKFAGIHPLHFNQIGQGNCGGVIYQHGWQMASGVGREDIAIAIAHAEELIEDWLKFPMLPRWIEAETVAGSTVSHIELARRKYITGGVMAKVLIEDEVTVAYSDADGDGYEETATISVLGSTILNPEEIALFYPASAVGWSGDDAWEIRPIRVEIDQATGDTTITCRREQLVIPDETEAIDPDEVDSTVDASFLETVDVYRRYNDPQRQVQFFWGCHICGETTGCSACNYTTQYGCLRGVDPELSVVHASPATWNTDDLVFDSAQWAVHPWHARPMKMRLWYQAGNRDERQRRPNVDIAQRYAQAITALAMAFLPGPLCSCMTKTHALWSEDLAAQVSEGDGTSSTSSSFKIGNRVLNNPFGTTRGAQRAWELVAKDRLAEVANYALY